MTTAKEFKETVAEIFHPNRGGNDYAKQRVLVDINIAILECLERMAPREAAPTTDFVNVGTFWPMKPGEP